MKFFSNYIKFVFQKKLMLSIILFLFIFLSFLGIRNINITTDLDIFMPKDSEYYENLINMNNDFGSGEQLIILLEFEDSLMTIEKLNNILNFQKYIESYKDVLFVAGPVPKEINRGLLTTRVEEVNEDNFLFIQSFINSIDFLDFIIEKDDKYFAVFTIIGKNHNDLSETIKSLEQYMNNQNYTYYISGDNYLQNIVFDYLYNFIFTVIPFAGLIIFITFRFRMGSLKVTFLSILPALLGATFTMGIVGWTTKEISLLTVPIPVFIIVLGSASGLHFLTHYAEFLSKEDKLSALSNTLNLIGVPLIMTTLTTVTGFLSLMVINSNPIKEMAIFSALGILMSGFSTIFILPLFCSYINNLKTNAVRKKAKIASSIKLLHGNKAFTISLIILLLSIPGLLLIETNFNILNFYKERTDVQKDIKKINDVMGGAVPVFISYDSEKDVLSTNFANNIHNLQKELSSEKLITSSLSFYDFLSNVNKIVYGVDRAEYPSNMFITRLLYSLVSNQYQIINNFINVEKGIGRIAIFPIDFTDNVLNNIENKINNYQIEQTNLNLVGIPFLLHEMNKQIITELLKSLFLALGVVFLMILITQKSFKIALFSILPITITLIALFGVMGYSGIDLNLVTIMMASLTIGVGIDYAIHFSGLYKYFKLNNESDPSQKAFYLVSTPIVANSLGLALGFTALFLSPFTFHNHISILMWTTMLVSSFLSLTLLPTLVKKFER